MGERDKIHAKITSLGLLICNPAKFSFSIGVKLGPALQILEQHGSSWSDNHQSLHYPPQHIYAVTTQPTVSITPPQDHTASLIQGHAQ